MELNIRVSSLLEVGTGFHPELTGRENIYLNGTILGMSKREIDERFDKIVAFSGVEPFVDTPVKRYSSGMRVRLAFTVAAHLNPEILLIDEVLAVGDAEFQKKCLGKMDDIAREGRTVLFVSHNMATIRSLCRKGMLIERGRLEYKGDVATANARYYEVLSSNDNVRTGERQGITDAHVVSGNRDRLSVSDPFEVACTVHVIQPMIGFQMVCTISNGLGEKVAQVTTNERELESLKEPGVHRIKGHFPALWLKPGVYSIYLKLLPQILAPGKCRLSSNPITVDVEDDTNDRRTPGPGNLKPRVCWTVAQ